MTLFLHGHATHPDARMALALAAAQIDAQRAAAGGPEPTLGWLYLTDALAAEAQAVLDDARARWPGVAWVGASSHGVCANGVEYIDEPALVLMLGAVPREHFRVFSGTAPLGHFPVAAAQVHADASTDELEALLGDLADRATTGYLFGGVAAGRAEGRQIADGVWQGGLSGVAFDEAVPLLSRVTQGCLPFGPVRHVGDAERNVVYTLDGEPALDALLRDLGAEGETDFERLLPQLRQTLIGLNDAGEAMQPHRGRFGADTRVRHLIGLDPARRGIALADTVEPGMQLAFCRRDPEAARRDLVRICAELREELEPEAMPRATALALQGSEAERAPHPARRIAGAIYVSCNGRGGPHFGGPSAELEIVRHALGDVPLVGFFAGGEIARRHLYGYTGVLTVFVDAAGATVGPAAAP